MTDIKISAEFVKDFFEVQNKFKNIEFEDKYLQMKINELISKLDDIKIVTNIRVIRWNAELSNLERDINDPIYYGLPITSSSKEFINSNIELFLLIQQQINIIADNSISLIKLFKEKLEEETEDKEEVRKEVKNDFDENLRKQFQLYLDERTTQFQLASVKKKLKKFQCGGDRNKEERFEKLWDEYFNKEGDLNQSDNS